MQDLDADIQRQNAALQATCGEIQQSAATVAKLNVTIQGKLELRQELHKSLLFLAAESRALDMQIQVNAAMSADEVRDTAS